MSSSSRRPDDYETAYIARRRELVEQSRGQRTRRLYRTIVRYLESNPNAGTDLEVVVYDCNWIYDTRLFGRSTEWLEDVLWKCTWDYMDTHAVQLCNLLRYMVAARTDLYSGVVSAVLDRLEISAMNNPWQKWIPHCKLVGQLAHDEFHTDGAESCNPAYVLAILTDTFNNSRNPGDKKNLVRGAAECLSRLGGVAAAYLGKSQYVSQDDWQFWIQCFEIFANTRAKSKEARAEASNAAAVMRYQTMAEDGLANTAI